MQCRTLALELARIARCSAAMVWHAVVPSMVLVSHSARSTLTTPAALEPTMPSAVELASVARLTTQRAFPLASPRS